MNKTRTTFADAAEDYWFNNRDYPKNTLSKVKFFVNAILLIALVFLSYERNRLWESPVILLNDVIKKNPQRARSYNNLGHYYYRKGMLDEALTAFGVSLIWDPLYAKGYCNVGAVYVQKRSYDDAIRYLNQAIALKPDFDMALFNLGLAYEAQGRRELAIEYFEKAAALGHNDARAGAERVLREVPMP